MTCFLTPVIIFQSVLNISMEMLQLRICGQKLVYVGSDHSPGQLMNCQKLNDLNCFALLSLSKLSYTFYAESEQCLFRASSNIFDDGYSLLLISHQQYMGIMKTNISKLRTILLNWRPAPFAHIIRNPSIVYHTKQTSGPCLHQTKKSSTAGLAIEQVRNDFT